MPERARRVLAVALYSSIGSGSRPAAVSHRVYSGAWPLSVQDSCSLTTIQAVQLIITAPGRYDPPKCLQRLSCELTEF